MEAAGRTPGQWQRGTGVMADPVVAVNSEGMRTVCELYYGGRGLEEVRANAMLIAAAPDLLALCERVLAGERGAALRRELREVVARAGGRVPPRGGRGADGERRGA